MAQLGLLARLVLLDQLELLEPQEAKVLPELQV
jgi:hypothetical protein